MVEQTYSGCHTEYTLHLIISLQLSVLSEFASENKRSSEEEQADIRNLLSKYYFLFYRALLTWKTKPVDIEL